MSLWSLRVRHKLTFELRQDILMPGDQQNEVLLDSCQSGLKGKCFLRWRRLTCLRLSHIAKVNNTPYHMHFFCAKSRRSVFRKSRLHQRIQILLRRLEIRIAFEGLTVALDGRLFLLEARMNIAHFEQPLRRVRLLFM